MVTVVVRLRGIGLAELQILVLSHLHARQRTVTILKFGLYPHDLRIEGANALCSPSRHCELDIGDAERDAPEARRIRLMAADAIAPGTCGFDVVILLVECEGGAFQPF